MARRGFFSRIVERVRDFVAPRREPEREQPPPAPPEPEERRDRSQYARLWKANRGGKNYKQHLAIFHNAVDPIEEDEDEREALWDSYIRNIVKGQGRKRRNDADNMFWRDSGIDPKDFKWQQWRQAMGYVGDKRSRS